MGTKQSRVGGDQSASSAAVSRAVRPPWKLEEVRETVQCLGRGRSEQETPQCKALGRCVGLCEGQSCWWKEERRRGLVGPDARAFARTRPLPAGFGAEEGCHPTFSKAPSSCLVENRLKRDTGGSGETSEEAPRSSRRERWLGWDLQGSPGGVRSGGLLKLL